jgi:hypothetical protein
MLTLIAAVILLAVLRVVWQIDALIAFAKAAETREIARAAQAFQRREARRNLIDERRTAHLERSRKRKARHPFTWRLPSETAQAVNPSRQGKTT